MTRTFSILASLIVLLLAATFTAGFLTLGMDGWAGEGAAAEWQRDVYLVHFFLGLCSALVILLVHCLIFTYFLGTGRWVKEVTLAYALPDEPWHKETRELKRWTFPPALSAMLVTIATAAAGAGAQLREWPWPVHATLGVVTLLVNLWAFRVEYRNVHRNAEVLDEVLRETDRMRAERGLPSNAEALRE